jgi:hypothetical protein
VVDLQHSPSNLRVPSRTSASLSATLDLTAADICRRVKGRTEGNKLVLTRDLTPSETAYLTSRRDIVLRVLEPMTAPERPSAIGAISKMLMTFPQLAGQGIDAAQAITASYLELVAECPLWAVEDACTSLARSGAGRDGNWAPAGHDLYTAVKRLMAALGQESATITATLAATVDNARNSVAEEAMDAKIAAWRAACMKRQGPSKRAPSRRDLNEIAAEYGVAKEQIDALPNAPARDGTFQRPRSSRMTRGGVSAPVSYENRSLTGP